VRELDFPQSDAVLSGRREFAKKRWTAAETRLENKGVTGLPGRRFSPTDRFGPVRREFAKASRKA